MQELCAEFGSAPTTTSEYEIRGKKYIVTSHYVGNKNFKEVFGELAFRQVLVDMKNFAG